MNRCIVIGGNGFIGKYIVQELLEMERNVTVLDIQKSTQQNAGVQYINTSNLSDKELQEIVDSHDEIIDLAYSTNPKTSYEDPLKDIVENLQNTVRIFELAVNNRSLKKFLYVSSGGAVYGNTKSKIINERHSTNPISPYGITKLSIEKYGQMFFQNKKLPFIVVRPSNAYGPGQLPNRGQGFIAQSVYNILHNIPVEIFGKKGTVRDYIFINDLAKGLVSVLDKGRVGEVYNIGTGIGYSNIKVIESLNLLARNINLKPAVNINSKRNFDVNRNILDCSKVKKHCNWCARINLENGLADTWNHFYNKKEISAYSK